MKESAEDFWEHYPEPRDSTYFLNEDGEFDIKKVFEFAEEYAAQTTEVVKVGEVLDVLDENLHYYKGDDGENHIDMFKLAHAVNDYYKSKTPISESKEEAQERYDKARRYYNEELGVTGLDVADTTIVNNSLRIAAGIDQREEPGNCLKEYNEDICDGCEFREYEMVSHPGGESTASVEKAKCELGYWEDDF